MAFAPEYSRLTKPYNFSALTSRFNNWFSASSSKAKIKSTKSNKQPKSFYERATTKKAAIAFLTTAAAGFAAYQMYHYGPSAEEIGKTLEGYAEETSKYASEKWADFSSYTSESFTAAKDWTEKTQSEFFENQYVQAFGAQYHNLTSTVSAKANDFFALFSQAPENKTVVNATANATDPNFLSKMYETFSEQQEVFNCEIPVFTNTSSATNQTTLTKQNAFCIAKQKMFEHTAPYTGMLPSFEDIKQKAKDIPGVKSASESINYKVSAGVTALAVGAKIATRFKNRLRA